MARASIPVSGAALREGKLSASLEGARGYAFVVAVQALVFVPLAAFRYADDDEGAYVLASRLVLDGQLPYVDFLHTQMPLLPYVYGGWLAVVGEGWYEARALAAAIAIGLGVLLYSTALRRFGPRLALLGVGLYASSSLVFGWFSAVKTHGLATLLLFAAYVAVERDMQRRAAWLAGGVLLGLAIDTRLVFAAAVPAFAWAALRGRSSRRGAALGPLAAGTAIGLLPSLVFLAVDAQRFVFDNLGYHDHRSSAGLVGDFGQKAELALNLIGVGTTDGAIGARAFGPQFLLLVLAATVAAVWLRQVQGRVPLSALVALLLGVASFAPTPAYAQYFSVTVPFLVVTVLELAGRLRTLPRPHPELARALRLALVAALAAYAGLGLVDAYRYVRVAGSEDARLATVREVAAVVDRNAENGERVLATWPGYLVGTRAQPVRGFENDFAQVIGATLSPADARRYGMLTAPELERMIEEGRVRIVVVKLWHLLPPVPDWEGAVARSGRYRLAATVGAARVYVRTD
jgi:hypothetical protein